MIKILFFLIWPCFILLCFECFYFNCRDEVTYKLKTIEFVCTYLYIISVSTDLKYFKYRKSYHKDLHCSNV
jgi:uncharacterized protein YqhQ